MVTAAEIKIIAERWKRATRPLKIQEQKYGNRLVRMLEEYNGLEFVTNGEKPMSHNSTSRGRGDYVIRLKIFDGSCNNHATGR